MIQTYSPTIRRKEMEAVLTCMVDERLGPGEMNVRLVQLIKENMGCAGAVALRSPSVALYYALKALAIPEGATIMLSALSPSWQIITLERLGYKVIVLDVSEENGLVTFEQIENGVKEGGSVLLLGEQMGILPDIDPILSLGIHIIEDISQSAFASYPSVENVELQDKQKSQTENTTSESPAQTDVLGKKAGMYASYAILGMEETDIITAGGGAVLIAPNRKEWTALNDLLKLAPSTDFFPDMNAALAFVEVKEFSRNEETRREFYESYSRAILSGRHKTFLRPAGALSTIYSFPLVLNSGFKDVKSYAQRKGIEVRQAYENSVIALRQDEYSASCICAKSLLLRCALFPLYPRLGKKDVAGIIKVLSSLP